MNLWIVQPYKWINLIFTVILIDFEYFLEFWALTYAKIILLIRNYSFPTISTCFFHTQWVIWGTISSSNLLSIWWARFRFIFLTFLATISNCLHLIFPNSILAEDKLECLSIWIMVNINVIYCLLFRLIWIGFYNIIRTMHCILGLSDLILF